MVRLLKQHGQCRFLDHKPADNLLEYFQLFLHQLDQCESRYDRARLKQDQLKIHQVMVSIVDAFPNYLDLMQENIVDGEK